MPVIFDGQFLKKGRGFLRFFLVFVYSDQRNDTFFLYSRKLSHSLAAQCPKGKGDGKRKEKKHSKVGKKKKKTRKPGVKNEKWRKRNAKGQGRPHRMGQGTPPRVARGLEGWWYGGKNSVLWGVKKKGFTSTNQPHFLKPTRCRPAKTCAAARRRVAPPPRQTERSWWAPLHRTRAVRCKWFSASSS